MKWAVVYEKAIRDDGSLFFPQKLTKEFLEQARRTMGSYLFANQYLNVVIPEEERKFKKEWFKYWTELAANRNTFIMIDPALSETEDADFTGVVVQDVDVENSRYVRLARRYRVSPTQLIKLIFDLYAEFRPTAIGIESVAYQKAIFYFLAEEMKRRDTWLPVCEVKPPTDRTKEMKILGLVPRFEWGHVYLAPGQTDLEDELLNFPRGSHDDLIDAMASMDEFIHPPAKEKQKDERPHNPNDPEYERWFIRQRQRAQRREETDD